MKSILSQAALADLRQIALYGRENFGKEQTRKYVRTIKYKIKAIANEPLLYPIAETKNGTFRKCNCESHSIYYEIQPSNVLIVRIIGMQDF